MNQDIQHKITRKDVFEHHKKSPEYYIQDVNTHPDDESLFVFYAMQDRAWEILTSPDVIEYYEDTKHSIKGFCDLSGGHCEDIACYAYEKLRNSKLDHTRGKVMCLMDPRQSFPESHHSWIQIDVGGGETYNFDVETPWGVSDYRHLSNLSRNPALGCVIGEPTVFNPLHESPHQVWGVHGYVYDVFNQRDEI